MEIIEAVSDLTDPHDSQGHLKLSDVMSSKSIFE